MVMVFWQWQAEGEGAGGEIGEIEVGWGDRWVGKMILCKQWNPRKKGKENLSNSEKIMLGIDASDASENLARIEIVQQLTL